MRARKLSAVASGARLVLFASLVTARASAEPPRSADPPREAWAPVTTSPSPVTRVPADPIERAILAECGSADEGLMQTARAAVTEKRRTGALPEADALSRMQRMAGEPHPWARAWSATVDEATPDVALGALHPWLAEDRAAPLRRCGVASETRPDGARVVAVVAVDAIADLLPLPVRVRTGQWLALDARMRVAASDARVFVLGPSGRARAVPSSFDGRTVRARFAAIEPGEITIQVVADLAAGPRPVVEATVFADVDPPASAAERSAPGEDAGAAALDDADRLARMLAAARGSEGLEALARDPRLDAIARAHAARMATRQALGHDEGDGTPVDRLHAAGLDARDVGENVAYAATVALAHRATWVSPSHHVNIASTRFDRVGVGVARDPRGRVWIAEIFASGRR